MQPNDHILTQLSEKGWAVTENWLSPEKLESLQSLFEELEFVPGKIGQGENLQLHQSVRGDSTSWVNPLLPPFKLLATIEKLDELRLQCNRQLFLGLRDWELHLAKYPKGAFYRQHSDRHERRSRRVLSVILYLNKDWQDGDGGELVLYNNAQTELTRVRPTGGTLVCFLSADFPHEVLESARERRSLTGWFLEGAGDVSSL